jgi:hypothetical protein
MPQSPEDKAREDLGEIIPVMDEFLHTALSEQELRHIDEAIAAIPPGDLEDEAATPEQIARILDRADELSTGTRHTFTGHGITFTIPRGPIHHPSTSTSDIEGNSPTTDPASPKEEGTP